MRQADIKRMERALQEVEKATHLLGFVEDHLWNNGKENKRIGERTEYGLVKEARAGLWFEKMNLRYKLEAIKEVNEE